jgi:hypothetical protein
VTRPESWVRPAGESPVWVIAGEPGNRPRFVVERRRVDRSVEGVFGGSKCAGRGTARCEFCSLVTFTTEEPSRSFHGEGSTRPSGVLDMTLVGVLSGYGERRVRTVWVGTGETHLSSLVSTTVRSYKPMVKSSGGKREFDGVVVLPIARETQQGGRAPTLVTPKRQISARI